MRIIPIFAALILILSVASVAQTNPLQLTSECGVDPYRPGMGVMKAYTKDGSTITASWKASDNSASGTVDLKPSPEWTYFSVPSGKTIILSYDSWTATKAQNTNTCQKDYFPPPIPEFSYLGALIALVAGAGIFVFLKKR